MYLLGISAFYHDSAAALIRDGEIVAAAQEERFSRIKHDPAFPSRAVQYCLREVGISISEVEYVVFYEKPLMKFERLLETYIGFAPIGFASFRKAIPLWAREKLFQRREIRRSLGDYEGPLVFTEHHESHAASAFYPSPFEEAAVLTIDGVGEWATTTIGRGDGNNVRLLTEQRFPHSLGLLYSAFTYYIGFRVNSGEYKLMGLAPYGEPVFADLIRQHLIDIKEDGSYRMDQRYFNYAQGLTMTNARFHRLFAHPNRMPDEGELTQFHMDVAASIQLVTEEIVLKMANHAFKLTGSQNLCLAGGVALNCVANGRVLREGPFEDVWIQPAAGDAGGALGAALFTWYHLLDKPRPVSKTDAQKASYLGPAFSEKEIRDGLDAAGAVYDYLPTDLGLSRRVAELLADEKVVGLFQGRMEFGPRALGARSILGDPRSETMQRVMNLKIKYRESFRPFAPSVLVEHAPAYFDLEDDDDSPYMLLVANVLPAKQIECAEELAMARGLEKLNVSRSQIPAVTHVDFSARIQTVDIERHGLFHSILKAFYEKTGCPVLINTSFNVRGEPIVCTPEDAYACFMSTEMDALVIDHCLLLKTDQVPNAGFDATKHLSQFAPD